MTSAHALLSPGIPVVLVKPSLLLALATSLLAVGTPTVTDLGVPDGLTYATQQRVNVVGTIAGNTSRDMPPVQRAFRIDNGVTTVLSVPGSSYSYAWDLSNDGRIAVTYVSSLPCPGDATAICSYVRPSIWNPDGTFTTLSYPETDASGNGFADLRAISPNGRIVAGFGALPRQGISAALRYQDGAWTVLHAACAATHACDPVYGENSFANGVNDAGQVAGFTSAYALNRHAAMWDAAGAPHDLGTLGGANSEAFAINNAGTVVGYSESPDGERAFRWNAATGPMQEIVAPGSPAMTFARDINEQGDVAGYACDQASTCLAFVVVDGTWTDLPLPTGASTALGFGISDRTASELLVSGFAYFAESQTYRTALWRIPITSQNHAPSAIVGGPYAGAEGASVAFTGSATDPDGDALTYAWSFGDGTTDTGATPSHVYGDNGSYTATLTVSDGKGGTDQKTVPVAITNVVPTATPTLPTSRPVEGSPFTLALANARDVAADLPSLKYAFDCGDGTFTTPSATPSTSCPTVDNGTRTVRLRVIDKDGGMSEYPRAGDVPLTVSVDNGAPTLGTLTVPTLPVPLGSPVSVSARFTDPGTKDTHAGQVQWDIGAAFGPAAINETNGAGTITASSTALTAGVYTIALKVTDKDGSSVTQATTPGYVVVYDPNGGFVTGGGWIMSPNGACAAAGCRVTGEDKATFDFAPKYAKGATVPTSATPFTFTVAGLGFVSTKYTWLTVGGPLAQFKGEGTVNGVAGYQFLVTAVDGDVTGGGGVDKVRVRIWNASGVVYDNQGAQGEDSSAATALGGGSIVIHK